MRDKTFVVMSELGRAGTDRGRLAEQSSLNAIRTLAPSLPWFKSVRLSTVREDRRGIDLVVETQDIGPLYLQVKSSEAMAKKWRHRHPRTVIAIVVIPFHGQTDEIWQRILPSLLWVRGEVERRRNEAE